MLERGCTGKELKQYIDNTTCRPHESCDSAMTKAYCDCPMSGDCGCDNGWYDTIIYYIRGEATRYDAIEAARVIREIVEGSCVEGELKDSVR